jgi:hypothetical protein
VIASISVPMQNASTIMMTVPSTPRIGIAVTIARGTAVAALDVSSLMCTGASHALPIQIVSRWSLLVNDVQATPHGPMH